MKPYSSSSEKENCSPLSSNCVEWQGPFIQCINICKGDSVSDIVYKLSEKVCELEGTAAVGSVNVTCLLESCDYLQAPTGTLNSLLQTIVDSICCSVGTLTKETTALTARTSNLYNEPSLVLPTNFQYTDPSTGLPVATLPLSSFAENTATNSSVLKTVVQTQTVQISNQENRIQTLESDPGYIPPTVTPLGTYGGVMSGVPTQMNTLLTAVENDYTLYKMSVGDTTDLINATSAQTAFIGSSEALGQAGVMSSIAGWNNSLSNLAQSVQNLWITVSDMRTAVNTIKQNIVPDCSQFILGYNVGAAVDRSTITLIFNSLTTIPIGFTNCASQSIVTITDGAITFKDTLDLLTYASDPLGIEYDVSGSLLNVNLPWTITVDGCIVNGGVTCSKTVSRINNPAATTTVAPVAAQYTVIISPDDINKAVSNTVTTNNGAVFISYFDETNTLTLERKTLAATYVICAFPNKVPIVYYYANNDIKSATSSSVYTQGACPAN